MPALLGVVLSAAGLASAFLSANRFWYSPFTTGAYLATASLNAGLGFETTLPLGRGRGIRRWVVLYASYVAIGAVIDVGYGRSLGRLWSYPRLGPLDQLIHVILIGYPFAFLSAVEMFALFHGLLGARLRRPTRPSIRRRDALLRALVIVGIVSLALPWLARTLDPDMDLSRLLVASMFGTLFLLDTLNWLAGRRSVLKRLLSRDAAFAIALGLTTLISGLLHEVPNAAASEWVYAEIPLTPFEIAGVSVFVLSGGWFFLIVTALSVRAAVAPPPSPPHAAGGVPQSEA